ncbi:MAG: UDP-N-acetylmuramoyl-tripeptide--D-alanyl-D-alanine ligase [Candidatus Pacebacteria bacterium]|nr:UDP-N-acetylmuramoyl-tripeptide--D-alanyl-D-alanine ligase [Candidatus Paceibacterota bacterium]
MNFFLLTIENISNLSFYVVFSPFLLIVLIKKLFFWTWLWQLKNYHSSRFLSHFQTNKGKKVVFNFSNAIKLFLLIGTIIMPLYLTVPILFVYIIESALALLCFLKKNFKYPKLTIKTGLILIFGFFLIFLFFSSFKQLSLSDFLFGILLIDLLSPIIFSLLIFCFWPITFFWQKRLINKAKNKRKKYNNLLVIGITGSYGKTSTKEFLYEILCAEYGKHKVLKTEKNQNSEVGISKCILNDLKPHHEIFICEMGAYNRGGIKLLCDIAQPKIGILTGINEQHISTFGTQEKIIKTKFELIDSLPKNGIAILNWNNELIRRGLVVGSKQLGIRIIKCSTNAEIHNLKIRKQSLFFKINNVDFIVNLAGTQNIENLLLAIFCAEELDMTFQEISKACEKIRPFEKTMELKQGKGGATIIDDTYSANPKGIISALDYLKLYSGLKIVIMPCLIELGKESKKVHKEIGEKIGKVCDLAIITTKDYFKEIKKGAISSEMKSENILFLQNPKKIFKIIKPYLKEGNVVLLESRVSKRLIDLLVKN